MTHVRLVTLLALFFVLGAVGYAQDEIVFDEVFDEVLNELIFGDPSTNSLRMIRGSIDKMPKGLDLSIIPGDLPPPSQLPPPLPLQQVLAPRNPLSSELSLIVSSGFFSASRLFGAGRKTATASVAAGVPPTAGVKDIGAKDVAAKVEQAVVKPRPPAKTLPRISPLTTTEPWKTLTLTNGRKVKAIIDRQLDGKYHLRLQRGGRMTISVEQVAEIKEPTQ